MVRKRNDTPAELARALSFQRANARAKSVRPEGHQATHLQARRFSKSIDALYVLASLKDGIPLVDALESEEQSIRKLSCSGSHIEKVAMSLMQDQIDRGQDLWDREFSSMSSCASDHDGPCGKKKGSSGIVGARPQCDKLYVDGFTCHNERKFSPVFDTDSSCNGRNFVDSKLMYICRCGDSWLQDEEGAFGAGLTNEKQKPCGVHIEEKSLTRRGSSLSAFLPADLQGVVEDSIAFVKFSHNPYKDFRESMYEMIMENELEECTDMEELLYCYLSLNAPEHHDLIKEAFSDVWSEILMRVS